MDLNLTGRVVMVAGASRGLGRAVAQHLVSERALLSIAARSRDELERAASAMRAAQGTDVLTVAADLSTAGGVHLWIEETVRVFGRIDHLCVNIGGPPPGAALGLADSDWIKGFEALVLGAIRMVRGAISWMAEGGSILFLTSSSVQEPIANLALSNVLRPAVAALSKTLSIELAPRGIRVNHLMPGRILTDRIRTIDEANAARNGVSVAEQRTSSIQTIPLGRYGDPAELARGAVFLLSPAASYITGASLRIDGGMIRNVA